MSSDESKPILTIAGEMIEKNKDYQLYREIESILRDAYDKILQERDKRKKEIHGSIFGEATEIADYVKGLMDRCIERQREIEHHYIDKARDMGKEKKK